MSKPKNIYKEVENITSQLISVGLVDRYNFPSMREISGKGIFIEYSNIDDISQALKNISYQDVYRELEKNQNYNLKMLDGALIQFLYHYDKSKLLSHRLAFFPSPFLESFQNEPEIYETDEIYADIIAKDIMPVPFRFDYDPKNYKEVDHPKCHFTLGQFENCRIPVCAPLTPNTFISFILRHFYNTAFKKFETQLQFKKTLFEQTITNQEKELLHLNLSR